MQNDRSQSLAIMRPMETPGDRAARLQAEARQAADLHVEELARALAVATRLAGEIGEGGDVYPAGVRDLCRRLANEVDHRALTLEALMARAP